MDELPSSMGILDVVSMSGARAKPDNCEQPFDGSAALTHADRAYEAIEAALISGEIPLGSRLGEEALSRQLGVSRGPLREALRQLEGRGLVERLPHSGARAVFFSRADLVELYEMREPLEGMVCRLAAERHTEPEMVQLRNVLLQHQTGTTPKAEAWRGEFDFHILIAKACRSRRLERALTHDLYSLVRLSRLRIAHLAPRIPAAADEHIGIMRAIESRDPELAELLMRRHIAAARKHIEQNYVEPEAAAC